MYIGGGGVGEGGHRQVMSVVRVVYTTDHVHLFRNLKLLRNVLLLTRELALTASPAYTSAATYICIEI